MPQLDIVIPVYNEAHVLAGSVEKLRAFLRDTNFPYTWRVVVADNASTDATLQVAEELSRKYEDVGEDVGVVHLPQKGRGRALKKAWLESDAEAMSYMDVDLSTDLAMLTPLLAGVCEEGYAIAYGSRLAKQSEIKRSLKRELNSRGYVLLVKLLFRAKFSDAQCGFKAITREAAQALLPRVRDGEWFFDTELLILAEQGRYKLKEVPVKWVEDPDTRVKFPDDIIKMVSRLVKLRFRRG